MEKPIAAPNLAVLGEWLRPHVGNRFAQRVEICDRGAAGNLATGVNHERIPRLPIALDDVLADGVRV